MKRRIIQTEELHSKYATLKFPQEEVDSELELLVKPGQSAAIYCDGVLTKVFSPGRYKIAQECQLHEKRKFWNIGGRKALVDIYFIDTTVFMNNGWGTKNPILRRDSEFDFIRLRAFGKYAFRITDSEKFINTVFGTRIIGSETTEICNYVSNMISEEIAIALSESQDSVLDLATQYTSIAARIKNSVNSKLNECGVLVTEVIVEHIGSTDKVSDTFDDFTSMQIAKRDFEHYKEFMQTKAEAATVTPGNATVAVLVNHDKMELGKVTDL